MTRTDCILKLLRHGALTFRECANITGWPRADVRHALNHLRQTKRIKHNGDWNGQYYLCCKPA